MLYHSVLRTPAFTDTLPYLYFVYKTYLTRETLS